MINLTKDWANCLQEEMDKPYFKTLSDFIDTEYAINQVFPDKNNIFEAFNKTDLKDVKCVIIGQDPYHDDNQAHGLCFSVKPNIPTPPSLVNIYKELNSDVGCEIPNNGYLQKWANQGVLMLNAVLTVRAHEPASHQKKGWEIFTDSVIRILNEQDSPIVFILWGGYAKKKEKMLNNPKHLILTAPHPSPLSVYRGFYGCKHFSKTNEFLVQNGLTPIDWQIDNI